MKHVRKFDEQNFDELSQVLFTLVKINYCGITMCLRGLRTCKFHISVLELASYNSKRMFACFSTVVMSVLQLAIDQDDDGITFNKHDPGRLSNFFLSGGSLSSGASFLYG